MKKTVVIMAITIFLSSVVVAQAGVSWEFNTPGDTEGWSVGNDRFDSLTNGLLVASAVSGSETVLTSTDVTGIDPQLENTETNSAAGEYWSTIEIRMRQLDGNGGSPVAWDSVGCAFVVNGTVKSTTLGGVGWSTTNEVDGWIVTTFSLPYVGTNHITQLRIDPVGNNADKNFEVDYVELTTRPTPPALPKHMWECNTSGDTGEWVGHDNGSLANGVLVTNAVSGSEVVLTVPDVTGLDPQLRMSGIDSSHGCYWTTLEIRMRQLDGNAGNPVAWNSVGCALVVNGVLKSSALGGDGNSITESGGEWIVATYDMSYLGINNLDSLRVDPVGNTTGKNFEVDYIRLRTRSVPLQPALDKQVWSWEFNAIGDTEGFTAVGVDSLTAANAINGSESVLTCADVTGVDPQLKYNAGNSSALAISPEGSWKTLEVRLRQLDKNPGDAGVASLPFTINGTLVFINPGAANSKNLGGIVVTKNEADNWVVASVNISYLGRNDFISLRLDPVGNDATKNFEVDYIRLYAEGGRYDAWTSSYGLSDALPEEDPDNDGRDNLYEYAFNGNPTNSAEHGIDPAVATVEDGGTNWFEYVYLRRIEFNNGLDYSLKLNEDLVSGSWINLGDSAVVGFGRYNDDYDAITNRVAIDVANKFLQLNVEKQ